MADLIELTNANNGKPVLVRPGWIGLARPLDWKDPGKGSQIVHKEFYGDDPLEVKETLKDVQRLATGKERFIRLTLPNGNSGRLVRVGWIGMVRPGKDGGSQLTPTDWYKGDRVEVRETPEEIAGMVADADRAQADVGRAAGAAAPALEAPAAPAKEARAEAGTLEGEAKGVMALLGRHGWKEQARTGSGVAIMANAAGERVMVGMLDEGRGREAGQAR